MFCFNKYKKKTKHEKCVTDVIALKRRNANNNNVLDNQISLLRGTTQNT